MKTPLTEYEEYFAVQGFGEGWLSAPYARLMNSCFGAFAGQSVETPTDGKITRTYHVEDAAGALRLLSNR